MEDYIINRKSVGERCVIEGLQVGCLLCLLLKRAEAQVPHSVRDCVGCAAVGGRPS